MIKPLLLRTNSKRILKKLQVDSGLFRASPAKETGYDKAWIRDNIYEALGLESVKDIESVKKTYDALFKLFLKHEYKIDHAIKEKPDTSYKYIHARYHPESFDEIHDEWGNMQNDAVGAFLFKVADLEKKRILKLSLDQKRIVQKLVFYLISVEYWHDSDNGIWENEEEIHASSVGACLAGLKSVKNLVYVPSDFIDKGQHVLNQMLPRESISKETDLALLTLIYPYHVVSVQQRSQILKNIEQNLVKEKGVIRYEGDWYYANGSEAQWVMGFAWLAKIYKDLGNKNKYKFYMNKLNSASNWKGEIPELYYKKTNKYVQNENTPLGWSHAMYLIAVS